MAFTSILTTEQFFENLFKTKHRLCGGILKIKQNKESICKKKNSPSNIGNNLSVSNNT
jgi:hypothetical protein